MQIVTIVRHVTGEGKNRKTELQVAGNVSLTQAQQMLTELTIALSKNEGIKEAKERKETPKKD